MRSKRDIINLTDLKLESTCDILAENLADSPPPPFMHCTNVIVSLPIVDSSTRETNISVALRNDLFTLPTAAVPVIG